MKKKGFTLIELLAVIIILAVIALIAVPQIIKILNKARKSAAEDTVYGIVKSVDTYVANFMLQNNGSFPRDVLEFVCSSDGCSLNENTINNLNNYNIINLESLDFKGTKPTSGTIRVSDNGKIVTTTNLEINGFTCGYMYEQASCFKENEIIYYSNIEATELANNTIYFNPETSKICSESEYNANLNAWDSVNKIPTGLKSGCMKWYVYSENNALGTKNLILDHNTTANNIGYEAAQNRVLVDASNWNNNLNVRNIEANEVAKITSANEILKWDKNLATSNDWFYFDGSNGTDTVWHTQIANSTVKSNYMWLFDYLWRCEEYGCNIQDNNSGAGYWTGDIVAGSISKAWRVTRRGYLYTSDINDLDRGVRPVITISKF